MSEENVELVRGWFERWNTGQRTFDEDEVDPDVEVVSRLQAEPFQGRDGFRRWMREIDEQFDDWRLVVDDWRDAGEAVVALGHIHLRGQESGVEFDQPMGWVIEVRERRLTRMQTFVEPSEALEAAGLAE